MRKYQVQLKVTEVTDEIRTINVYADDNNQFTALSAAIELALKALDAQNRATVAYSNVTTEHKEPRRAQ